MVEADNSAQDADNANSGQDNRRPFGYLQGVLIFGAWAFIGLLLVAVFWPNLSERTKFFTGNLWNLVIAFAVVAQVLVYRKQAIVMEDQLKALQRQATLFSKQIEGLGISERGYIGLYSGRLVEFEAAKDIVVQFVFINGGKTPAWNFEVQAIAGFEPKDFRWNSGATQPKVPVWLAGERKAMDWRFMRIDASEKTTIEQSRAALFVRGEARYIDYLGNAVVYPFSMIYDGPKRAFYLG